MLPGSELDELDELVPAEAAEELLARMLAYARYRGAAAWARERFELGHALLFRSAPLPAELRRANLEAAEPAVFDPAQLGRAIGGLLRHPPPLDLEHMRAPAVSLADRLGVLRGLLRRGSFDFEEAVRGTDRMTVCVTLYALLELYKRGEASWEQDECFGDVTVTAEVPAAVAAS
jgi:segregation and condensation protein A